MPIERVAVAPVDTSRSPDEGVTSGSRSIEESNEAVRRVAAEARLVLLRAAATASASPSTISAVSDGVVRRPMDAASATASWRMASSSRRRSTGERPVKASRPVTASSGQSTPRVDLAAKVVGGRGIRPGPRAAGNAPRTDRPAATDRLTPRRTRRGRGPGFARRSRRRPRRQLHRRRRDSRGTGDPGVTTGSADRHLGRGHANALPVGPRFLLDRPTEDMRRRPSAGQLARDRLESGSSGRIQRGRIWPTPRLDRRAQSRSSTAGGSTVWFSQPGRPPFATGAGQGASASRPRRSG